MHADTGLLAVVGSIGMMLALDWRGACQEVRSSRLVRSAFPILSIC